MIPKARVLGLLIEWTCHGLVWMAIIGLWLTILWARQDPLFVSTEAIELDDYATLRFPTTWSKAVCLLVGVLLDMAIVGTLKFLVRRPRPEGAKVEDMLLTVSVDSWSFPSGECFRGVLSSSSLLR